jgi:hypothetical protein
VLSNCPPVDGKDANAFNNALALDSFLGPLVLIDAYALSVDPLSPNNWDAAYSDDNLHGNVAWNLLFGNAVRAAVI